MKRLLLIAMSALALTGCATQDYKMYADTQRAIASANATAESAKYAALAEIARTGDSAAKVAAVMSINFAASNNNRNQQQQILPPKSAGDIALQWTSLLLPNLTQFYSINANRQIAVTQSNNATALGVKQSDNQALVTTNTNATFANIAGAGLTAVTTTAGAGLTATVDVAKAGLTATTTVSGQGNTTITNVSNNAKDSITAIADAMKDIQPNVTTTTNNTLPAPATQP